MINLIKYIPVLLITIIFSDKRGWTHPETGWQVVSGQNMCIFTNYNSYIDNEIAEFNQNDAIGVSSWFKTLKKLTSGCHFGMFSLFEETILISKSFSHN